MLMTARLKCIAESKWESRRYLDVSLLDEYPYRTAGHPPHAKRKKDRTGSKPVRSFFETSVP